MVLQDKGAKGWNAFPLVLLSDLQWYQHIIGVSVEVWILVRLEGACGNNQVVCCSNVESVDHLEGQPD